VRQRALVGAQDPGARAWVVLLHAKFIRPFVQTNKTDAADARAIWTAVPEAVIPEASSTRG